MDCVLLVLLLIAPGELMPEIVGRIKNIILEKRGKYPEKVLVVYPVGEKAIVEMAADELEGIGIPIYTSIERCAWVLSVLARASSVRSRSNFVRKHA